MSSNDYPFSPGYTGPTGIGVGGKRGTPVPPRLTPPYERESLPRKPVAVPGSPPVTLPYTGVPLPPPPVGAGIIPRVPASHITRLTRLALQALHMLGPAVLERILAVLR